jgi:hypothetical protein
MDNKELNNKRRVERYTDEQTESEVDRRTKTLEKQKTQIT